MKTSNISILIALSIIVLTSCQKVINIDLNDKKAEVMIEGLVTDDPSLPQTITITKSVNFSADNIYPAVSGATVNISDNLGNAATLAEVKPGVYQTSSLLGASGRTYYLNVVIDGKVYTSESTMPAKINLDTILVGQGLGPGGPNSESAIPVFTDPFGKGNNYKFALKRNKIFSKEIFITDDQIVDGGINNRPLSDNSFEYKPNDTISVTMMCIDQPVYLYFFSLSQNGNGPNASATPANPVTNIKGATLGYFSAHTIQVKKIVYR
jgi:hypothetical protein